MPLDPQAQALLAAFAQAPTIDFAQLTVPAYRASLAAGGVRPGRCRRRRGGLADSAVGPSVVRTAVSARRRRAVAADRVLPRRRLRVVRDRYACEPVPQPCHPGAHARAVGRLPACARGTLPGGRARRMRRGALGCCQRARSRRARRCDRRGRRQRRRQSRGRRRAAVARLGHCDRAPVAAVSGRRLRDRASVVRNARQRLFPDGGRDALVQAPLFRRRRRSRVAARGRSPRRTSQAWRRRRSSAPNSIRCATRPKRMRCASRRPAPRWRSCAGRASFMVSRACSARSMQPTAC